MNLSTPHYLLFSDVRAGQPGTWRFVLRPVRGRGQIEVSDEEPAVWGDRLELLTVVRGLEALDQPSKVTLVTSSKYVREGIRYGLSEWRSNGWRWESYGEMVPVKNRDLWQRVDRAMRFHHIECRMWRIDSSHQAVPSTRAAAAAAADADPSATSAPEKTARSAERRWGRAFGGLGRQVAAILGRAGRLLVSHRAAPGVGPAA